MAHDRADSDELKLTHEFLATMLGVRRPGVTVALHLLERQGPHPSASRDYFLDRPEGIGRTFERCVHTGSPGSPLVRLTLSHRSVLFRTYCPSGSGSV